MKRRATFFLILFFMMFLTMACAIGYEGLQISDDPEPVDPISEMIAQQTFEANTAENFEQDSQVAGNDENQSPEKTVVSGSSDGETNLSGENEYSVTATNFGCTCSVDGNSIQVELKFNGDQLEYAGKVYDKIDENTYQRSYMGYYILVSGEGDNETSTQVDEERHDIIILTEDGFISEHYQGDEPSPCCFHTFTLNK